LLPLPPPLLLLLLLLLVLPLLVLLPPFRCVSVCWAGGVAVRRHRRSSKCK
jgi:hypothetical protein